MVSYMLNDNYHVSTSIARKAANCRTAPNQKKPAEALPHYRGDEEPVGLQKFLPTTLAVQQGRCTFTFAERQELCGSSGGICEAPFQTPFRILCESKYFSLQSQRVTEKEDYLLN